MREKINLRVFIFCFFIDEQENEANMICMNAAGKKPFSIA
jgi:hypothetical protein